MFYSIVQYMSCYRDPQENGSVSTWTMQCVLCTNTPFNSLGTSTDLNMQEKLNTFPIKAALET